MAYFNHAFTKSFLVTSGGEAVSTNILTAGEIGIFNNRWQPGVQVDRMPWTIAVGSHHVDSLGNKKDKIGNNPGHGGYAESVKTKGINGKFVHSLSRVRCDEGALPSATISVGSDCAPCGENLFLRVDVKGSPALRFLNHNAYSIGDSSGDASQGDVPGLCCVDDQEYLDPAVALAKAADMILKDPLISPFIKEPAGGGIEVTTGGVAVTYTIAGILDGTYTPSTDPTAVGAEVTAKLTVEGAYVDTKFGNCSFDTRDHYEKEPVSIVFSLLDETGDPCNDCGVATSTPGRMATTSGETVLRALLLTESYMQNPYNQGNRDSARIREIELSDDIVSVVDRDALYNVFRLQHTVPRYNNPTGVFDNDQYVYNFYVKCGDETGEQAMDQIFQQIREACQEVGNPIDFEQALGICGGKEENGGEK